MTEHQPAAGPGDPPVLRVVSGEPDPAELAALVAVLTARASAAADPPVGPTSAWGDRSRAVRAGPAPEHGPGAWRASGWPG